MRRSVQLAAIAAGTLLALGTAAPAMAAPGDHGQGVGGCIDELFGNATNERPSGHGVLPSQSPGPWVNNPADPDNPSWGTPLGQLIQQHDFNPSMLRQFC